MEVEARQITEGLKHQKHVIEIALQAVHTCGGECGLEETLRIRLRDVNKKLHRSGDADRTCLRAIALERHAKVLSARAESKADEARANHLKLLVDLRTNEADIAKLKSKESAFAAKAALEMAKKEKDEAARLRAKQEAEHERIKLQFAAALVVYLDNCLGKMPWGMIGESGATVLQHLSHGVKQACRR